MKVHQLFITGALIVGALSLPAFAAAAGPAAATTGAPEAATVAGAAGSASETAAARADTARAVAASAAAPTCASWTTYFTGEGAYFQMHIPSTTRQGAQRDCVLRPDDHGAGVFILQDALIRCYSQRVPQNGIYGWETLVGVRNVQAFHKVKVDGVYGPNTRMAMTFTKYERSGGPRHYCWYP
jgi:peptidoglycan hydrolase-like protein with peptidoglycan-binding domain